MYIRKLLFSEVQPSGSPELKTLGFYLWGNLQTPVYLA